MWGTRSSRWLLLALLAVSASTTACDVAASTQAAGPAVGAATRAQDLSTQSSLRNALVAAKALYTETTSYDGVSPSTLAAVDPSLCYVGAGTAAVSSGAACEAGQGSVSVSVLAQGQMFAAAALSPTGTCFWVKDEAGTDAYGSGQPCTGAAATGASAQSF